MENPFARIAAAPESPHLKAVQKFRESSRLRSNVEPVPREKTLTVWMHRGYEGSGFTYLVTDGEVEADKQDARLRFVSGGTFVMEIMEVMKRLFSVKIRLRPGFDAAKVQSLLDDVESIRCGLRSISKHASQEDRTIEMVILIVD